MRAFFIILLKELRSFFLSPLAYVVMALFTLLSGFLFVQIIEMMSVRLFANSIVYMLFQNPFWMMSFSILFPIVTMRLFAEEKKMGTLEGLMTAPVRTSEVVLAKFAAAVVSFLFLLTPVILFFFIFSYLVGNNGAFDMGGLWGGFWSLFFMGLFYIALGMFASSITQNQLIAAVITFVFVAGHFLIGFLHKQGVLPQSGWSEIMTYFSVDEHLQTMSSGLIDSRPLIYYSSFCAVFLAFTHHVLEYRKWRA